MPHHPAPEIVVVSVPAHDAASDNFLAELKRRGTTKVIAFITSGCRSRDLIETFAQRAGEYARTSTITVQRDEALWWTWLAGMTTTLCLSAGADAIRQA
jgi:16S rRNA G1207 methylase RsmC